MNKFNVILLADVSSELFLQRPLGVHKIASELRSHGYSVQVINHLHTFSIEEIEKILDHLINDKTLFVGFSTFFYRGIEHVEKLSGNWEDGGIRYGPKEVGAMLPHGQKYNEKIKNLIKSKNKNCKLVLGGPDAQDAGYIKDYDYTVIGYADNAVINLANHLAYGNELLNSRRSINKSIIITDYKAEGYDFPGTQMFYDHTDVIMTQETLPIEIGRGCIFKCSFCSYPLNGKKKNDHVKLEEVLQNELIDNYKKFGTTRYIFTDDTFNDSIEKIKMVYRIAQNLPFKLEYWAYIRLDLLAAHPETIDMLFDSGMKSCHFGIETLHPAAGSIIRKGGDKQKLLETVRHIKNKYKDTVNLNGSFIFGLPSEPIESMRSTEDILLRGEFALDSYMIYPLVIKENTQFFKSEFDTNYAKFGYTLNKWNNEYQSYEWTSSLTNFNECAELAKSTLYRAALDSPKKVNGLESFYITTLGFDLEYSLNKNIKDFDWHQVDLAKQKKIEIYKKELYRVIELL
jgi:radical SAM superfamily enzyme YgiQ (UPF0313 family)